MSDETFADVKAAMEDALAFERGKKRELNIMRIQAPRTSNPVSPCEIDQISRKLTD